MADPNTLLVISGADGVGVPTYSARGLTQTLETIGPAAHLERALDGYLVDLSIPAMRLYQTRITCTDLDAPAFSGLRIGTEVVVDCVAELGYKTIGGSPDRPVIDLSSRVVGDYTYYRPRLNMTVTGFKQSFEEFAAVYIWELALEETGGA